MGLVLLAAPLVTLVGILGWIGAGGRGWGLATGMAAAIWATSWGAFSWEYWRIQRDVAACEAGGTDRAVCLEQGGD